MSSEAPINLRDIQQATVPSTQSLYLSQAPTTGLLLPQARAACGKQSERTDAYFAAIRIMAPTCAGRSAAAKLTLATRENIPFAPICSFPELLGRGSTALSMSGIAHDICCQRPRRRNPLRTRTRSLWTLKTFFNGTVFCTRNGAMPGTTPATCSFVAAAGTPRASGITERRFRSAGHDIARTLTPRLPRRRRRSHPPRNRCPGDRPGAALHAANVPPLRIGMSISDVPRMWGGPEAGFEGCASARTWSMTR